MDHVQIRRALCGVYYIPDTVLTEPALGDLSADHRALVKEYLQTSATMVWLIRCEFSASLSIVA